MQSTEFVAHDVTQHRGQEQLGLHTYSEIPQIDFRSLIQGPKIQRETEREPTEQEKTEIKYYNWAAAVIERIPQSWQFSSRVHDNSSDLNNGLWIETQSTNLMQQASMQDRSRYVLDILELYLVREPNQEETEIVSKTNRWVKGLLDGYIEDWEGEEEYKMNLMDLDPWTEIEEIQRTLDLYDDGECTEITPPIESNNLERAILTLGQFVRFLRNNNDLIMFGPASIEDITITSQWPFQGESDETLQYLISNSRIDNIAARVAPLPDDAEQRLQELQERAEFIKSIRSPSRINRISHSRNTKTSRWTTENTTNARTIISSILNEGLNPIIIEYKQRSALKYNDVDRRRAKFREVAQVLGYKQLTEALMMRNFSRQLPLFGRDVDIEPMLLILYRDDYDDEIPRESRDAFAQVVKRFEWDLWLQTVMGVESGTSVNELRAMFDQLERIAANGGLNEGERELYHTLTRILYAGDDGGLDFDALFGPSKAQQKEHNVRAYHNEFITLARRKLTANGNFSQGEHDRLDELSRRLYGQNYRPLLEEMPIDLDKISGLDPYNLVKAEQRNSNAPRGDQNQQPIQQDFLDQVETPTMHHYQWE